MVTAESVRVKIQALIDVANENTGNTDTNLTDAINSLLNRSGMSIQKGSFTPAEKLRELTLAVNGICSNLAIWKATDELITGQRTNQWYVELAGTSICLTSASNSSGTSWGQHSYNGWYANYQEDQIYMRFPNPETYGVGWLAAGHEYHWMAW
jgi:alanine racemase